MKCNSCGDKMKSSLATVYIKVQGYGSICAFQTTKLVCQTCGYELMLLRITNNNSLITIEGEDHDGETQ